MKTYLNFLQILLIVILFFCGSAIAQTNVIGNPIKIGSLEVAQYDFRKIPWNDANNSCNSLGDGWRLPTKEELNILYQNKEKIGNFKWDSYWSSTKGNVVVAWRLNFGDGMIYDRDNTDNTACVRAVRSSININKSAILVNNGQTTLTYANGSKYVGDIKDGQRNGHGTLTFNNLASYVGEFKDDNLNGQGTLTYGDGRVYVGSFVGGQRNGQGTFTHKDGSKYVGEWANGKRNGHGTFTYTDGSKYIGEFYADNKKGQGTLTYADGTKYVGEFFQYENSINDLSSNNSSIEKGIYVNGVDIGKKKEVIIQNLHAQETIKIGLQTWMGQNLNVDKFRNGDPIPQVKTDKEWIQAGENKQPAWCYYYNEPTNDAKYGKLYNWYAVNDQRGLAPEGWHIPSDDEWSTLTTYLGGEDVAGTKLKEAGTLNWSKPNTDATNQSGFSALPGGMRSPDGKFDYGYSKDIGVYGLWWSSTKEVTNGDYSALSRLLVCKAGYIDSSSSDKKAGLSVRVVLGSFVNSEALTKSIYGSGKKAIKAIVVEKNPSKTVKTKSIQNNVPSGVGGFSQQELLNLIIKSQLSDDASGLDPSSQFYSKPSNSNDRNNSSSSNSRNSSSNSSSKHTFKVLITWNNPNCGTCSFPSPSAQNGIVDYFYARSGSYRVKPVCPICGKKQYNTVDGFTNNIGTSNQGSKVATITCN